MCYKLFSLLKRGGGRQLVHFEIILFLVSKNEKIDCFSINMVSKISPRFGVTILYSVILPSSNAFIIRPDHHSPRADQTLKKKSIFLRKRTLFKNKWANIMYCSQLLIQVLSRWTQQLLVRMIHSYLCYEMNNTKQKTLDSNKTKKYIKILREIIE